VKLLLNLTDLHWRALKHGEEFSLSGVQAARIVGFIDDATGVKLINELTAAAFLGQRGVRGCPPTHWFVFLSSNYRRSSVIKTRPASVIKTRPASVLHISNSLREVMKEPMRKKLPAAPEELKGGKNGSLRSNLKPGETIPQMMQRLKKENGLC
jgi:hypothetical protein